MLANVLRRGVAQAARGQVRKMSLGEQLKDVKDVKVKDAVRFFGDKAKDPAVQQAARVRCAPPRICGCAAAVRIAVAWGAAGARIVAEATDVRRPPRIRRTCGREMRGFSQTPPPGRRKGGHTDGLDGDEQRGLYEKRSKEVCMSKEGSAVAHPLHANVPGAAAANFSCIG